MELLITYSNNLDLLDLKKAGATGIIVGSANYSHRFAAYYNLDELAHLSKEVKKFNLTLYLSLNRIIHEEELSLLYDFLAQVHPLVDGIYFNDLSILHYAKKLGINSKCLFNPDTLMTNNLDCQFYLNQGLKGLVLSKEITLEEILDILAKCTPQLDLIIHGRLNMSYSKRHFLKSYFNYLNKSKTILNQTNLRLQESTREELMPILEEESGTSIYTDFTLESFNEIVRLKQASLQRAIIDSIFLEPSEVLEATLGYSLILNNQPFDVECFINNYPKSHYTTGYHYQKTNLVK